MSNLRSEIQDAINRHSAENGSNTPDFILADYLAACLINFDAAVRARESWYGRSDAPGLNASVPAASTPDHTH